MAYFSTLDDFPDAAHHGTGWPWERREDVVPSSALCSEKNNYPKISIVTPSLNQGQFIEATIRSVLLQEYPNLEYIVIDGGSTDQTLDIVEQYAPWLDFWSSEPDEGLYQAINKGFAHATGEIMGWLNADDLYVENALWRVAEIFHEFHGVEWIASRCPGSMAANGNARFCRLPGYSAVGFWRAEYVEGVCPFHSGWIPQESTFWRRSLWERAGGQVDESLALAGDFELWARFYQHAELVAVDIPLGVFRRHSEQKTHGDFPGYVREAREVLHRHSATVNNIFFALIRKMVARMPNSFRLLLSVAGLSYQSQMICKDYLGENWEMKKTYV